MTKASVAETSERPADFANASPFRMRKHQRDPVRTILFVAAVIAALVLLAAIAATLMIRLPAP